ncbi:MAG: CRISPR system precrRNA processing endoribonuclease RAMP protein Cas6 [Gammaproteobacteria bacterium]|nr:CRISPR system precrRNA processing endoribonuclease RAMP protein Cas6 [Gammaproteobacteria bacterium]
MTTSDHLNNTPDLPIGVYRFTFEAKNGFELPAIPGMLWHSIFGKALRQISCTQPGMECEKCLLLYDCDYPLLFRPIAPPDSEILQGKAAPNSHVFRCSMQTVRSVKAGECFDVEMVIVGDAARKLGRVIKALQVAGMNGIGKKRSQADLLSIKQICTDGRVLPLVENGEVKREPIPPVQNEYRSINSNQEIKIQFTTPYIPPGKEYQNQFNLPHMMMGVVRRVSLLQYFYTGKRLYADFPLIKSQTETALVASNDLKWQSCQRYSATHNKVIKISGWIGSVNININMQPLTNLWPFLFMGEWLNTGKNASMGFGRYQVIEI